MSANMSERLKSGEFSQDFYIDLAYFHFVRLAHQYGKAPAGKRPITAEAKITEVKARLISDSSRVFPEVQIPTQTDISGSYDSISGIDYGSGAIEIHYGKGENAGSVSFGKDFQTGRLHITGVTLFKRSVAGDFYVKTHLDSKEAQPDAKGIVELLIRAEKVIEKQKSERLAAMFNRPRQTIRQRLSRRIEESLR